VIAICLCQKLHHVVLCIELVCLVRIHLALSVQLTRVQSAFIDSLCKLEGNAVDIVTSSAYDEVSFFSKVIDRISKEEAKQILVTVNMLSSCTIICMISKRFGKDCLMKHEVFDSVKSIALNSGISITVVGRFDRLWSLRGSSFDRMYFCAVPDDRVIATIVLPLMTHKKCNVTLFYVNKDESKQDEQSDLLPIVSRWKPFEWDKVHVDNASVSQTEIAHLALFNAAAQSTPSSNSSL